MPQDYSQPLPIQGVLTDPNYIKGDYEYKTNALDTLESHNLRFFENEHNKFKAGSDGLDDYGYAEEVLNYRSGIRNKRYEALMGETGNKIKGIAAEADVPVDDVATAYMSTLRGEEPKVDPAIAEQVKGLKAWSMDQNFHIKKYAQNNNDTPYAHRAVRNAQGVVYAEEKVFRGDDGQMQGVFKFNEPEEDPNGKPVPMGLTYLTDKMFGASDRPKTNQSSLIPLNTDISKEINRLSVDQEKKNEELKKVQESTADAMKNPQSYGQGLGPLLQTNQVIEDRLKEEIGGINEKLSKYTDGDRGMSEYLHDQMVDHALTDPALRERLPSGATFGEAFTNDMVIGHIQGTHNVMAAANLLFGNEDKARSLAEDAKSMDMVRSVMGLGKQRNDTGLWSLTLTTLSDQAPMLVGQAAFAKLTAATASRGISTLLEAGTKSALSGAEKELAAEAIKKTSQYWGGKIGAFVGSLPTSLQDASGNLADIYGKVNELENQARSIENPQDREAVQKQAQDLEDNAANLLMGHFASTALLEGIPMDNLLKRYTDDLPLSAKVLRLSSKAGTAAERTAEAQAKYEVLQSRVKEFWGSKLGIRGMEALSQGATEGVTEFAQQVSDNAIAKQFYDENRKLFEGGFDSTASGVILGAFLGFGANVTPRHELIRAVNEHTSRVAAAQNAAIEQMQGWAGQSLQDGTVAASVEDVVKQRPDGKFIVDDPDMPVDADIGQEFDNVEDAKAHASNRWERYGKKKITDVFANTDSAKVNPEQHEKDMEDVLGTMSSFARGSANGASSETIWKSLSNSAQFRKGPEGNDQIDSALPYLDKILGNTSSKMREELDKYQKEVAEWAADPPENRGARPKPAASLTVALNSINEHLSGQPVDVHYPNEDTAHANIMGAIGKMSDAQLRADIMSAKKRLDAYKQQQGVNTPGQNDPSGNVYRRYREQKAKYDELKRRDDARKAKQTGTQAPAAAPAQAPVQGTPNAGAQSPSVAQAGSGNQDSVTLNQGAGAAVPTEHKGEKVHSVDDVQQGGLFYDDYDGSIKRAKKITKDDIGEMIEESETVVPGPKTQSAPATKKPIRQQKEIEDPINWYPKETQDFFKEVEAKVEKHNAALMGKRHIDPKGKRPVDEDTALGELLKTQKGKSSFNVPTADIHDAGQTKKLEARSKAVNEKEVPDLSNPPPDPMLNLDGTLNMDAFLSSIPEGTPIGDLASLLRDILPLMDADNRSMRLNVSENPAASGVRNNEDNAHVILGDGPGTYDTIGEGTTVGEIIGHILPRAVELIVLPKVKSYKDSLTERKALSKDNQKSGWQAGREFGHEGGSQSQLEIRAAFEIAMPGAVKGLFAQDNKVLAADVMKALVVKAELSRLNKGDGGKIPSDNGLILAISQDKASISDGIPTDDNNTQYHVQKTADGRMFYFKRGKRGWETIPVSYTPKPREMFNDKTPMGRLAALYLRQVVAHGHFDTLFGHTVEDVKGKTFYDGLANTTLTRSQYKEKYAREAENVPPYEMTSLSRFIAGVIGDPHFSMKMDKPAGFAQPYPVRQRVFDDVIGRLLGADVYHKGDEKDAIIGASLLASNARQYKRGLKLGLGDVKGIPGPTPIKGTVSQHMAAQVATRSTPGHEEKGFQDTTGDERQVRYDENGNPIFQRNEDIQEEVSHMGTSTKFEKEQEGEYTEEQGRIDQKEGLQGVTAEDKAKYQQVLDEEQGDFMSEEEMVSDHEQMGVEQDNFLAHSLSMAESSGDLKVDRKRKGEQALLGIIKSVVSPKVMKGFNPTQSFRVNGKDATNGSEELGVFAEVPIAEEEQGSLALMHAIQNPAMTKEEIDKLLVALKGHITPEQIDEVAGIWHKTQVDRDRLRQKLYRLTRKSLAIHEGIMERKRAAGKEITKENEKETADLIAQLKRFKSELQEDRDNIKAMWKEKTGGRKRLTDKEKEQRDNDYAAAEDRALIRSTPTGYNPKMFIEASGERFGDDLDTSGQGNSFIRDWAGRPINSAKGRDVLLASTESGFTNTELREYIGGMYNRDTGDYGRLNQVHDGLVQLAKQFGIPLEDRDTFANSKKKIRVKVDSLRVYGSLETALYALNNMSNPQAVIDYLQKVGFPNKPALAKVSAMLRADPTLLADMHAMASGFMDDIAYKMKEKGQRIFMKNDVEIMGKGEKASHERQGTNGGIVAEGERPGETTESAREKAKFDTSKPKGQQMVEKGKDAEQEWAGPYVAMDAESLNNDPANLALGMNKREWKAGASRGFNMRATRFSVRGTPATAVHTNGIQPFFTKGRDKMGKPIKVEITEDSKWNALGGRSVGEVFQEVANTMDVNSEQKELYRMYKDIWRQVFTTSKRGMETLRAIRDQIEITRSQVHADVPLVSPEVDSERDFSPATAISQLINEYIPSPKSSKEEDAEDNLDEDQHASVSDSDVGLDQPASKDSPRARIVFNKKTGKSMITVFRNGDPTSLIHEMVHWMRLTKLADGMSLFENALGDHYGPYMEWATKGGTMETKTREGAAAVEERIAAGAEQYMRVLGNNDSGLTQQFFKKMDANNPVLVTAFKKVANMFRRIYDGLKSFVDLDINAVRGYDALFGATEPIVPTYNRAIELTLDQVVMEDARIEAQKLVDAAMEMGAKVSWQEATDAIKMEKEKAGSELMPNPAPGEPTTPDDPETMLFQTHPSGMGAAHRSRAYKPTAFESLRVLFRKGQKGLARWLIATQGQEWQVFNIMQIKLGGRNQTLERDYINYSKALEKAMEDHISDPANLKNPYNILGFAEKSDNRTEIHRQVNAYLGEQNPVMKGKLLASLPTNALRKAAATIRVHVDQMSDLMIKSGIAQGPLKTVINSKKGSYLHRSYDIVSDPDRHEKLQTGNLNTLYLAAIQSIKDTRHISEDAATAIANQIITAGSAFSQKMGGGNAMAKGVGVLMEEKNPFPGLEDARDMLWGLKKDPLFNYQNTVRQMGQLLSINGAVTDLLKYGTSTGLIVPKYKLNTSKTKTLVPFFGVNEAADPVKNPVLAHIQTRLSNFKSTPEVAQYVKEMLESHQVVSDAAMGHMINRINGAFKWNATVGNWETGLRNLYSSTLTMLGNGHGDPRTWAKAVQLVWSSALSKEMSPQNEALFRELQKFNIAEEATISELKDFARKHPDSDKIMEKFLGGAGMDEKIVDELSRDAKKIFRSYAQGSMTLYNSFDVIAKISAYLGEKSNVKSMYPNMVEADVQEMASKRTHLTMFSFDMTPKLLHSMRTSFPFTAPFTSFVWAMARTSVNILKLGFDDIRQGLTRKDAGGWIQAGHGMKRLVSFGAVASAGEIAAKAMASMLGWDDKDMDALRKLVNPWDRNGTIIPLGSKYNDNLKYINVSNIMPYSVFTDAVMAMFRNDDAGAAEKIKNSLEGMWRPLLDEQYILTAARTVYDKQNRYGEEVNNWKQVAAEIVRPLMPGHVVNLARKDLLDHNTTAGEELGTIVGDMGIRVKPMSMERKWLSAMGIRTTEVPKDDVVRWKAQEWLAQIKITNSLFTHRGTDTGAFNKETFDGLLQQAIDAQEKAINEGYLLLDHMKSGFGMTNTEVEDILKQVTERSGHVTGGKFNEEQVHALSMTGAIPPRISVTKQQIQNMNDAAEGSQFIRTIWLKDAIKEGKIMETEGR